MRERSASLALGYGGDFVEEFSARVKLIGTIPANPAFYFSCGMDPAYSVIGHVISSISAVTLRERYGANERSQKLKFHSQTSGRSLHAQEIAFNDIRTTLQALISTYDNTNSLHTNDYHGARPQPTEAAVRRREASQRIITRALAQ